MWREREGGGRQEGPWAAHGLDGRAGGLVPVAAVAVARLLLLLPPQGLQRPRLAPLARRGLQRGMREGRADRRTSPGRGMRG